MLAIYPGLTTIPDVERMAEDYERHNNFSSPPSAWGPMPHIYPHSHHGTPAQEYSGFGFNTSPQIPMEPNGFATFPARPTPPQLSTLIMPPAMPQWPSQLNNAAQSGYSASFAQQIQPIQPMMYNQLQTPVSAATPVSASSTRSSSTPRKTLTDADRKKMCQFHERHPNSKQTEIGAIFGVERSTVSKVLRQKDKYLKEDEGTRSPLRRPKGRSPDLERTLGTWARNEEKKGVQLTDNIIKEKARAFASTITTSPESHYTTSPVWIEKFKLNYNLMGMRSRKSSLAVDDLEALSGATSSSHTPGGVSPISPEELRSVASHEVPRQVKSDDYLDLHNRHLPFHSHSATSLSSAYTDTAPSTFSPGPLSPPSPFFTPDSGTAAGEFVPPLTARPILSSSNLQQSSTSSHSQRPRSQTFPQIDVYGSFVSSADVSTPRYIAPPMLDSRMEEPPDTMTDIDEIAQQTIEVEPTDDDQQSVLPPPPPRTVSPIDTMCPPPVPSYILASDPTTATTTAATTTTTTTTSSSPLNGSSKTSAMSPNTSPEEAREALEVVMAFIEQQPRGFLDFHEMLNMGKLMEKLRLQSPGPAGSMS